MKNVIILKCFARYTKKMNNCPRTKPHEDFSNIQRVFRITETAEGEKVKILNKGFQEKIFKVIGPSLDLDDQVVKGKFNFKTSSKSPTQSRAKFKASIEQLEQEFVSKMPSEFTKLLNSEEEAKKIEMIKRHAKAYLNYDDENNEPGRFIQNNLSKVAPKNIAKIEGLNKEGIAYYLKDFCQQADLSTIFHIIEDEEVSTAIADVLRGVSKRAISANFGCFQSIRKGNSWRLVFKPNEKTVEFMKSESHDFSLLNSQGPSQEIDSR